MTNVATRLLSLILLLQSQPAWKAGDLAEKLDVSERTVHRYMGMLDEMGMPIYSEGGPYGVCSLVRGYKLPPLIFTPEEATVLYMGANLIRDLWGRTYEDAVTSVTAKLDNVLPDDLRQEVAEARHNLVVGGLTALDYRPWDPVIHTLRRCIGNRHCVKIIYKGFNQQETERLIDPYALALQWGLWYLVGYCHLRKELRTFRVDRISKAEAQEGCFTPPRDFSVREHLDRTMRFEPVFRVVVNLSAEVAPGVRERHGHWMQITDHEDGSCTARFAVTTLDWVTGWALSLGPHARVTEPADLVARGCDMAERLLHHYAETETEPAFQ